VRPRKAITDDALAWGIKRSDLPTLEVLLDIRDLLAGSARREGRKPERKPRPDARTEADGAPGE
jgi:hypothetical protein